MDNLRKGFPVLEQYTYLNTAASGLLHERVWEFRQDHDMDFLIQGSILKEKMGEMLTEVRERLGEFMKCAPNRVALIPNFSYGFNSVLESLDKPKKALLIKNDYPSINWPVESRNFEVVYAELNEKLEDNIIEQIEKEKPYFFAFSIVQYINGVKLSIEFLKQLKERFPDLILIADGTQYFGTEQFNFDTTGIDVVISSCYKWMNAGYGNGFMLFNESIQGKLSPKHLGFGSLQGKYKAHEGNFIGKFEPGHYDTLNFGSLKTAVDLIEQKGIENISKQIDHLKKIARDRFASAGLLEKWTLGRDDFSSLFNIKGDEKLFNNLREEGIITSQRGDGIRISLHYFNSDQDLDKLFRVLKI
ncbi:aminotransferase class V-fold PLP-dependent enzyme [Christiangramia sediminicola]|uniref:Aminotransferase class V-fold PLP-dependent enzyme n=1 Tax=Christiangramia sediminicola TaxID=3073267 RepID=A0ABU1EML8_9FLAO|nr:aminotransferase class V-fold PLP-dependent enzyme [Christiangramia sp. SM2212]MDR5589468.1 aminotransferase class V-fold PLP-dependent enzyme [Christiangramia sp. SM2212]